MLFSRGAFFWRGGTPASVWLPALSRKLSVLSHPTRPHQNIKHAQRTHNSKHKPTAARLAARGADAAPGLEALWDALEPLLLDGDLENQEAAVAAAAAVAHRLAAAAGAPTAAARLEAALGRLCAAPDAALREEGACQALALAVRVLSPSAGGSADADCADGSSSGGAHQKQQQQQRQKQKQQRPPPPLGVADVEPFASPLFLSHVSSDSPGVREVAAAALPAYLRRLPAARRALFIPDALVALANDSHWNVRAAAAPLLLRLARQLAAPSQEERRWLRTLMGNLLEDDSPLVRVPAMAALGPFLLALPGDEAAAPDPPLLDAFARCARVHPGLAADRAPSSRGRWRRMAAVWEARGDDGAGGDDEDEDGGDAGDAGAIADHHGAVPHAGGDAATQQHVAPPAAFDGPAGERDRGGPGAPPEEPPEQRQAAVELPVVCAFYLGRVLEHCGAEAWGALADAFEFIPSLHGNEEALNCWVAGFPRAVAAAAKGLGGAAAREELSPPMVALLRTQPVRVFADARLCGCARFCVGMCTWSLQCCSGSSSKVKLSDQSTTQLPPSPVETTTNRT